MLGEETASEVLCNKKPKRQEERGPTASTTAQKAISVSATFAKRAKEWRTEGTSPHIHPAARSPVGLALGGAFGRIGGEMAAKK